MRSFYRRLCKSKKHLKPLCIVMELFCYPFIHSAGYLLNANFVPGSTLALEYPMNKREKSCCLLGTYFLMGGDR